MTGPLTSSEWATHQHRDTSAAIIANDPLLSYLSIADGDTKARTKFEQCERMLQPCGPPPVRTEE